MDMKIFKTFLLLKYIIGMTQCQLVYHNPELVENGEEVEIVCHFVPKPPGHIYWYLQEEAMTRNCEVYSAAESVLYVSDKCDHPTAGNATYAFIIRAVDIDQDKENWRCAGGTDTAYLNMNITDVVDYVRCYTESGSFEISQGDSFKVTCESSCAYPYQEIKWCFLHGDSSGCSNKPDYWTEYFDSIPEITYHNTSCSSSKYLHMYGSTFKANVLEGKNRGLELDVSISFGTNMFEVTDGTNKIRILYCSGCLAIWAIFLIVILIILVLIGGICGGIKLKNKYSGTSNDSTQHTPETDVKRGKATF